MPKRELHSCNPITIMCNDVDKRKETIIEGDTNTMLDLIRSSSYIHVSVYKDGKCYSFDGSRLRSNVPIRTTG